MSRDSNFSSSLNRAFMTLLFVALAGYLGYQYVLYLGVRRQLPPGTTIATVAVGHLTPEEARAALTARYFQPVRVIHRSSSVEVDPASVGFVVDIDGMLLEATAAANDIPTWQRFGLFLLDRPLIPIEIPLAATHDEASLRQVLTSIAEFLDKPAHDPEFTPELLTIADGSDGFRTDIEASLPAVTAALYASDPAERQAQLVVVDESAAAADISMLADFITGRLETFSGDGSFFFLNLATGEEILINADQAMSGTSTIKIAIVLETYRVQDQITFDQAKLISETLTLSGNYSANLLLDVVAGQDNAYLGSDILTQSMQDLGLVNTFIATPFEEPARPDRPTVFTPANTAPDADLAIDSAMQTTAEDVGTLLSMIYYCAQGRGVLPALYPEQLTAAECQELITYLTLNHDGQWLFHDGLPPNANIAHKHGWIDGTVGFHGTHSDAAIVFSPGGDYVLVGYLYDEGWLDWQITGPIMRDISRAAYNFMNPDQPFVPTSVESTPLEDSPGDGGR